MSNYLAIATVTAALGHIVHAAAEASGVGSVTLDFGRPTAIGGDQTARKVHIYLYQVSPNASLRNNDLPTRGPDGKLVDRPQAALDLRYLIAFYGNQQSLEPDRMLGAAVRNLHARPLISRKSIQDTITNHSELKDSNLADAVERVRFTPAAISLDELSKLWSVFFQTPHALSVVYDAKVVLIEAEEGGSAALPVLHRGKADRGVETTADTRSSFPTLESIHIVPSQDIDFDPLLLSYPCAQLGLRLLLRGQNLNGDVVRVHFRHKRFSDASHPRYLPPKDIPVDPRNRTATQIDLPNVLTAQTEWRVGRYGVSVTVETAEKTIPTKELELLLAPRITSITPNPVNRVDGNATVTIACSPQVIKEQTVTLSLKEGMNEISARIRTADTNTLVFFIENAPQITDVPVRLNVDDVYSQPFEHKFDPNHKKPPSLEVADNQKVTIT